MRKYPSTGLTLPNHLHGHRQRLRPYYRYANEFEIGLDLILDALERLPRPDVSLAEPNTRAMRPGAAAPCHQHRTGPPGHHTDVGKKYVDLYTALEPGYDRHSMTIRTIFYETKP